MYLKKMLTKNGEIWNLFLYQALFREFDVAGFIFIDF